MSRGHLLARAGSGLSRPSAKYIRWPQARHPCRSFALSTPVRESPVERIFVAEVYIQILSYHRVVEGVDSPLAVTPAEFSRQMAWLKEAGYVGVPLADAVAARAGRLSGQAGGRGGA